MKNMFQNNCSRCDCRKKTLIAGAVFLGLVFCAVFLLAKQAQTQASDDWSKWKNFNEDIYGLSIDYPAGWTADVNYDRYAPGIISAELNNKKCGAKNQCGSDCVDVRVLVAKKPVNGQGQGLLLQFYEDFMMVRDFSISPLVSEVELDSKKIFQVESGAPTLALNGACPGPLYVFETDSGYFAYVFAGYGTNAVADGEVRKIIDSVKIIGN